MKTKDIHQMKYHETVKRGTWRSLFFIIPFSFFMLFSLSCSQDDENNSESDPVAVNFTTSVDGAALPSAQAAGTRGATPEFTGITEAGVPYRDYTDADGFSTRAFYPEGMNNEKRKMNNEGDDSSFPTTRTIDNASGQTEWVGGDEAGIFMLKNGGKLTNSGEVLADNVEYRATPDSPATNASFAPANAAETIYYPHSGAVDFVAYYPYGGKGTGAGQVTDTYIYKVSVSAQSTTAEQAAIDILYAKAANVSKSNAAVNLAFDHALSKLVINVKAGDGIDAADIRSLSASDVTIGGMPTEASLALNDGELTAGTTGTFNPLKAGTATATYDATFSAILVPQPTGGSGRTVVFAVGGSDYTWTIPDAESFTPGNHYTYPVTVQKLGVTMDTPTITPWTGTEGDPTPGTAEPLPVETVKIKAGTFHMGSPESEPARTDSGDWVETQHQVTLTKDFYMGKYPVTNAQYAAFLNATSIGSDGKFTTSEYGEQTLISTHIWGVTYDNGEWKAQSGYDNHPVIFVTWYGAAEYARWIGGSLPTEAQWEYACRGNYTNKATETATLPFGIGDGKNLKGDMANINGRFIYDYDNGGNKDLGNGKGTYLQKTSIVGNYIPNNYGLYDMHGNVWEWCNDWFEAYSGGPETDPTGPVSSPYDYRVLRGGSWNFIAQSSRSAYRNNSYPFYANDNHGFRVVFVP